MAHPLPSDLSQEKVRELLQYESDTGRFFWRNDGSEAGTYTLGYRAIRINGRRYFAHRLAWLYVCGRWPRDQIDHIDRDKSNNRIANLREATASQNRFNRWVSYKNRSGIRGVRFEPKRKRWRADIRKNGRTLFLGRYETPSEAMAVYARAAQENSGEFACNTPSRGAIP